MNFVHIAILPGNAFCRLAILTELRYNSISTEQHMDKTPAVTQEREATLMKQKSSSEDCRLVYLTRRAYETGEIRLLLRTDNVCAEKDTGWQLLQGSETGLELSNPGNSLLVSVARALEIEPKLAPLLTADTPPQKAAYAYDEKTAGYRPTAYPEDVPTEI